MAAKGKALLFGFLIWFIAFAVAFAIFPIRESWRSLFESIMPVVIAIATSGFAVLYFRRVRSGFLREGIAIGCLWLAINVIIDLPLMSAGPMAMSLVEYLADIGLTYLIIPAVTVGIGLACQRLAKPVQECA
jgi:uncharacterized membrane protein YbhN (UPF0104 family)